MNCFLGVMYVAPQARQARAKATYFYDDLLLRRPLFLRPTMTTTTASTIVTVVETPEKTCWYVNDQLHRDDDLPAVEFRNGRNEWYQHGLLHRDHDLPAIVQPHRHGGFKYEWYRHGKMHRDNDMPADVYDGLPDLVANTWQIWYQNGKRHRDNGPAIIYDDVMEGIYKAWYQHDELHRDGDLPAKIRGVDYWAWYCRGKLHRFGGPATMQFWRASLHCEWYVNNIQVHSARQQWLSDDDIDEDQMLKEHVLNQYASRTQHASRLAAMVAKIQKYKNVTMYMRCLVMLNPLPMDMIKHIITFAE